MDFSFSKAQEALRREVRTFLEEENRRGAFEPTTDGWIDGWVPKFSRKVGERGWLGVAWPPQYRGRGWGALERLIITEEMLRAGAPCAFHWIGERQVGPCLLAYGSEEQKRGFLPRIARGEVSFALGMSEPNAGSDLASLQTRAVEDGDEFIINGQKIWTSGAHVADYLYMVARTDPTAPKHKGISEFIIDLKSPGISIRPLYDVTGSHHFNEVFFDNVRVPRSTLVGEKNRGWYQIVVQLDYERGGLERIMSNYVLFGLLKDYVKGNPSILFKGEIRHRLADLEIKYRVGRLLIYRVAWLLSQGIIPNYETATAKVFGTAFEQQLAYTATQVLGLYGQLLPESKGVPLQGLAARSYVFSPGYTLRGGTSEVLRNIVAMRGFGLPGR